MRVLLGITAFVEPILSKSRDEYIQRLRIAAMSALESGANCFRIITNGYDRVSKELADIVPQDYFIYCGANVGHAAGECALVTMLAHVGAALGADYVIKCPSDCLHNTPKWAEAWVSLVGKQKAGIISDKICNNYKYKFATQTKVFVATPDFLLKTWRNFGFPEAEWYESICRAKLQDDVYLPEYKIVAGGGQMYFQPADTKIKFIHRHKLSELQQEWNSLHSVTHGVTTSGK